MGIDDVSLYAVVRVKVRFFDHAAPSDPAQAVERATRLVDWQRYLNHYSNQGPVQIVEFEGTVLGGVATYDGPSTPDTSGYVARDPVTPFMDPELLDALGRILSSPSPSLEDLLFVAKSNEPALATRALQGIVLHPQATSRMRRGMLWRLADTQPELAARWLEANADLIVSRLDPSELLPLLKADDAKLRETAIRVMGRYQPRTRGRTP